MWQWTAGTSQDALARLGARDDALSGRYVVPSERTFRRVLTSLDGDALDQAISGYLTDVIRGVSPVPVLPAPAGPVEREQRRAARRTATRAAPGGLLPAAAIDGKLSRGTVTPDSRVFLVAAIAHRSGIVLGQRQVADKRGEGTAVEPLLAGMDVAGMVLTLDAFHTTRLTAQLITDNPHAHDVLILKGNQPLAPRATQALLSGTDVEFADHTDIDTDRGHGRTERRTLRVAPVDDTLFPAARQVFRIRRDTGGLDGQRTRKEIVHGITSMPGELAAPVHLNHHTREHWCVENRLHWVRDVTFHEDHSQPRTGSAPRALATFRNLTVGACRLADRVNIAHSRRDLHDRADTFAVYSI